MSIKLEIISPEAVILSKQVEMAVLPASEGDIAAMEGHVPMIFLLRGGIISLYEGDKVTDSFFVEGGFAEMQETQCTVLANNIRKLSELSAEEGYKRLTELEQSFKEAANGNDVEKQRDLVDEIQCAQLIIDVVDASKHKV